MLALDDLLAFDRRTRALAGVAERLGWDQETVMPKGAADQRAEEIAAMAEILHARRTDPRVGAWLAAVDRRGLDPVTGAKLREIGREYDRMSRVPGDLAAELARITSLAHGEWAGARAAEDFAAFAPTLTRILALKREEAAALADGGAPYDALLDGFEPGATAAEVAAMFDTLRPRLVALADRVLGSPRQPAPLNHHFDETKQAALGAELARGFGYDMTRGRIDKAVHPFSSGTGADVRITTRTDPRDPFNGIYSTIHETGHGAYEQGIDPAYALTPLGHGASMGVHESQSRIYENQLGRSRAFTGHLFARMRAIFGNFGVADAAAFYAIVNRVAPGHIRTEADEVHYNLHILLRFDLERALIERRLEVADLEEAWNARFLADFGTPVDRPSNGVLQDVHWAAGLFGYFPTYALGNVYAGCLHRALRRDVPDLDTALAAGDSSAATAWLRDRLQRHGSLRDPGATIAHATGAAPTAAPLLDYLETKFAELYNL